MGITISGHAIRFGQRLSGISMNYQGNTKQLKNTIALAYLNNIPILSAAVLTTLQTVNAFAVHIPRCFKTVFSRCQMST